MRELTVLEHNAVRVLTTEQLAEAYGCDTNNIKKNFNANKDRFIKGKHFYVLAGDDLRRLQVTNSDLQISSKTRHLYLWTKQGAARHSKMLGTDRAWDVFDELEESYFNPTKGMTPEEFLLYTAQQMVEQSKAIKAANARIDKVDERLLDVESKQMTIDQQHYTIIGYANLMGIRGVSREIAAKLGRKASVMSRKQGYHIGKEYDAKYGVVNTYHVDVLQEIFRK